MTVSLLRPAPAAPILYDEAIDGDLSWTSPQIFSLDLGLNQILGSVTWAYSDPLNDFDSFVFEIPMGTRLQAVHYQQEVLPTGSGILDFVGYRLEDATMTTLMITVFSVPFNGTAFLPLLPLDAGSYTMNPNSFTGVLREGDFRSAAYSWSLDVVPVGVPEPSTLVQFALGAAALTLANRRRRWSTPRN